MFYCGCKRIPVAEVVNHLQPSFTTVEQLDGLFEHYCTVMQPQSNAFWSKDN
jgi:hypothetical protein